MAWTSIKVIRFALSNSVNYILNKEKSTLIRHLYDADDPEINAVFAENKLANSIDYALNRDKTETTLMESALNCNINTAYQDMMATKVDYEKLNGVQGYHLVQSFKGHEASPELAHKIARELSERLHGGRYQVVISTHLNTNNIHNHIVWNSVSHVDGAKYVSNAKSYYKEVRRISDELCHKYGLSIIHPEQGSKGKSYAEWQAEKKGEPTWRSLVRKVVDAAIQESFTFPQFLDALESQGWAIKFGKHIAVRPPGKERYIRLKSLGEQYTEEAIRERIVSQSLESIEKRWTGRQSSLTRPPRKFNMFRRTTLRSAFSMRGLKGLYFHYLYRMGVLPQKSQPADRNTHFLLQEDIRQLDKRIRMYGYIQEHGIETMSQLQARRDDLKRQADPLLAERKGLYKKRDGQQRISEINRLLKPLHTEMALCRDIEKHSLEISGKLRAVREAESKLKTEWALSERTERMPQFRERM